MDSNGADGTNGTTVGKAATPTVANNVPDGSSRLCACGGGDTDEGNPSSKTQVPPGKKWAALVLFSLFALVNGYAWLVFDPVATELPKAFPSLTPKSVELLSSWQPLMYLVACIPMTKMQRGRDGLRRAVLFGAAAEVGGVGLKVAATFVPASSAAPLLLHFGQIFCAVASPVAIGAPASLSAQWFAGTHYRTRATAIAVVSNNVGNAIGFAVVPLFMEAYGFSLALYIEAAVACILLVLVLVLFPSREKLNGRKKKKKRSSPLARLNFGGKKNKKKRSMRNRSTGSGGLSPGSSPEPEGQQPQHEGESPGKGEDEEAMAMSPDRTNWNGEEDEDIGFDFATAEDDDGGYTTARGGRKRAERGFAFERESLLTHIKALLSLRSGVLLLLGYAWSSGSYVAWTSLYEELVGGSVELNAVFVSVVTLLAMAGYIAGGLISSWVTDMYFSTRMKTVLVSGSLISTIFGIAFIILVIYARQGCTDNTPTMEEMCPNANATVKFFLICAAFITGGGTGGAAPIFYELLAEISYPIPETVSGNALSLIENIGSLLMYQLVARFFSLTVINIVFVTGMIGVSVTVGFLVKEVHLRPGQQRHTTAGHSHRSLAFDSDDGEDDGGENGGEERRREAADIYQHGDDDGDDVEFDELEAHNEALPATTTEDGKPPPPRAPRLPPTAPGGGRGNPLPTTQSSGYYQPQTVGAAGQRGAPTATGRGDSFSSNISI